MNGASDPMSYQTFQREGWTLGVSREHSPCGRNSQLRFAGLGLTQETFDYFKWAKKNGIALDIDHIVDEWERIHGGDLGHEEEQIIYYGPARRDIYIWETG